MPLLGMELSCTGLERHLAVNCADLSFKAKSEVIEWLQIC
jgi:hypothetical protein